MYNSQTYELNRLVYDEIIIYLRKSRQDDPNETVEEVLSRHEMQLQDFALRTWGAKIPEENIYRERIVSGETIDERPEIQKVLNRVQDSKTKAVLVIEPPRLTRGDMLDLGTMVHSLRYTNTLCITPVRTYNLEDKFDRRYFEDELKRGNDYLEYTKEILMRGRRLSASQGYWVQSTAPFGYDRERQKNRKYILVQNENSVHVRMIFEWFAEGIGMYEIAQRLTKMGVPTMKKRSLRWHGTTIRQILKNDVYIGIVRFGEKKTIRVYENGVLKKKSVPAPESEHIVAKGLHVPIITNDLWDRVQSLLGRIPKTNSKQELSNPLAGLLFCKKCGFAMTRKGKTAKGLFRLCCQNAPVCTVKSVDCDDMIEAFQNAMRGNVAEIEEKINSGASSSREIKEAQLSNMLAKMDKLQDQEDHQYDLLERKEYTPEVFNRRHARLLKEMETLRAAIEEARTTMPEAIDYDDALVRLHAAIDAMDSKEMTPLEKNIILKSIVSRVEYNREKGGHHNTFEIDIYLKL